MSAFSDGIYVVSWAENRDSPFSPYGSIYAQDIDLNGKLGPLSVTGQSNPDGSVKIYPNPSGTAAWLVFSTVATGPAEIHIFNLTGQEVSFIRESITPGSKLISLDVSRINPGVYLVRILFNGNVQTLKWVVTY